MSDDLREWLQTIPVVTDADKAELREAIKKLEAQQRGTRNAQKLLCEMLKVDDGSQILDAIHGLKERIRRLEEAGDLLDKQIGCGCVEYGPCQSCGTAMKRWTKAKEAKP